jgi:hypothetical protein
MNTGYLDDIHWEVRRSLEDGKRKGETEVEIVSRLVCRERRRNYALCCALEEIARAATSALNRERGAISKTADVLGWHIPLH